MVFGNKSRRCAKAFAGRTRWRQTVVRRFYRNLQSLLENPWLLRRPYDFGSSIVGAAEWAGDKIKQILVGTAQEQAPRRD